MKLINELLRRTRSNEIMNGCNDEIVSVSNIDNISINLEEYIERHNFLLNKINFLHWNIGGFASKCVTRVLLNIY